MQRFRWLVIVLTAWLFVLSNIDNVTVMLGSTDLTIYISPVVVILNVFVATLLVAIPRIEDVRLDLLFLPILVIYLLTKLIFHVNLVGPKHLVYYTVIEVASLLATLLLARVISLSLTEFEKRVERVLLKPTHSRILPMEAGEQRITEELLRAQRYNRPLSFLYLITEQTGHGTLIPESSIFQKYYLRGRIGDVVANTVYQTDIITWHNDDLFICMPETSYNQALLGAEQLHKRFSNELKMIVPIGVATFPEHALIYDDLAAVARQNLLTFTERPPSGSPPPPTVQSVPEPVTQPPTTANGQPEGGDGANGTLSFNALTPSFAVATVMPPPTRLRQAPFRPTMPRTSAAKLNDPDFWVNRLPTPTAQSREIYRYVKRLMDLSAVIAVAPIVLPLMIGTAIAIFLETGMPVFYVQKRTGRGGRVFKMYKFRSMIQNADQRMKEMGISFNERGETVNAQGEKLENDPRVTRVGRIIRKTSLDELPQFWNVFVGDMSLVGPRPTSFGIDKYGVFHTHRLSVKPGLTGLWQVYARGNTDFDSRLLWDMRYIERISFLLDTGLLIQTALRIFKDRGAR